MLEPDFRPYGATANILAIIERARTRNLPELVGADFFALADIPEIVYGRVRQGLEFLQLVHEDGRPTDKLQSLAKAPDSEYQQLLATCIREAYREDFARIDPEQELQGKIIEAFRRYQPRSQTSRMVMLFLGLCRAAGIPVADAPRERKMQVRPTNGRGKRSTVGSAEPNPTRPLGGSIRDTLERQRDTQSTLFAITEADIASLEQTEFDTLWEALGKVARARARQKAAPTALSLTTFPPEVHVETDADAE
ncbi:MAG TPA: DUF5343 domain-containing protein [Dehalococcoidia bacterium]